MPRNFRLTCARTAYFDVELAAESAAEAERLLEAALLAGTGWGTPSGRSAGRSIASSMSRRRKPGARPTRRRQPPEIRRGQGKAGCPGSDSRLDTGRSERIRTSGPCLPKAVLYQAELHSGWRAIYCLTRAAPQPPARFSSRGRGRNRRLVERLPFGGRRGRAEAASRRLAIMPGAVERRAQRAVPRHQLDGALEVARPAGRAAPACAARRRARRIARLAQASTTGKVILPSRKSSPTVLPSSAWRAE